MDTLSEGERPHERSLDASDLAQRLDGIEGWLYLGEAHRLYESVKSFPLPIPVLTVVEIGSWKGRSTVALALALSGREGKIFSIDPHTPAATGLGEWGEWNVDTFDEFLMNLHTAGVHERVVPVRKLSSEAVSSFAEREIDVLFVDGAHDFEGVAKDILLYTPKLRNFAKVAFNDPSIPGVYKALLKSVLRYRSHYFAGELVENTLFFNYERNRKPSTQDLLRKFRLRVVLRARFVAAYFRPYMPQWFVRLGHRVSATLSGSRLPT
jgi:hypothetical protein